jgi:hypothetical protein
VPQLVIGATLQSTAESGSNATIVRRWATSDVVRRTIGDRAVYIKQYHQSAPGMTPEIIRLRTGREMEVMRRLAGSGLLTGRLGLVRLVDGDPAAGRLVTEEAPGRTLHDFIIGDFRRSVDRECLSALFLAGRWLRRLQQLAVQPGDEVRFSATDPPDIVEYCDLRIRKVLELGYGWPCERDRARIRGALLRLIEAASSEDSRFVWTHGDYGPQNILWDGSTITPLDFNTALLEYPLHDITYFIHRLEMLAVYFPWRRWPLAAWRRALLRGYGRPDAERSPMYRALMIRHLHCRLQTYVRRPPGTVKQRAHTAYVRQRVRWRLLREVRSALRDE